MSFLGGPHEPVSLQHLRGDCAWEPAFSSHLQNGRKHGVWSSMKRPDPFSSGRWFRWFGKDLDIRRPLRRPPIVMSASIFLVNAALLGLEIDDLPGPRHYPIEELDLAALAS